MSAITVNGRVYTDDSDPQTGLANGGHRTRLIPLFRDTMDEIGIRVSHAANAFRSVSTTPLAIGTGPKELMIEIDKGFSGGDLVLLRSYATPSAWMLATIVLFSAPTGEMRINVAKGDYAGSGTYADWVVAAPIGPRGPQGLTGFSYNYDVDLTGGDPGPGNLRMNTATISASTTTIYIDMLDSFGKSCHGPFSNFAASTSAVKGQIWLRSQIDPSQEAWFNLLGATSGSGYWIFTIQWRGPFPPPVWPHGEPLMLDFSRTGDKGEPGATGTPGGALATGDVLVTAQKLTPPTYLPCNGSLQPQGSFPALFAQLGFLFSDPVKLPDPSVSPTGVSLAAGWSGDGGYLAIAHAAAPYLTIYKRSGDQFAKLPNPAYLPNDDGQTVGWSPDGTYLAFGYSTAPYLVLYKRTGDSFAKLPDPTPALPGYIVGLAWSPDGSYLATAHAASPFVTIYKRSGDSFAKIANPATLPAGIGVGVAWSPDGTYLSVGHGVSQFLSTYKRAGDVFTKLPNPATLPLAQVHGLSWSPDGVYLAAPGGNPRLSLYKRSADQLVKLADLANPPTGYAYGTAWSADGALLAVATDAAPYVIVYRRSGDVFTRTPDPAILPSNAYGVAWSPDNIHLVVAHAVAPFVTIYAPSYDRTTQFLTPSDIPTGAGLRAYIKT